jgi:hypothetical protein
VQEGLLKYYLFTSIIVVQIPAEKQVDSVKKAIVFLKELEQSIDPEVYTFPLFLLVGLFTLLLEKE